MYFKERQELIYPKRMILTGGNVKGAERLLTKKEMAVTFSNPPVTRLTRSEGDEAPFVLLDFGRELHGSIRLLVSGASAKNASVRIVLGESVSEALSDVGERGATNDHSPRDITALVSNMGIMEFCKSGFRFAKIELLDIGYIDIKSITAVLKTADVDRSGYIKTDDQRLNEILETAVYTAFLCAQDGAIYDGIKRDRIIWSGDLNCEILTLSYMYGVIDNVKHSLEVLKGVTGEGEWINNIPTYSAWWILNLCDYVMLSGDVAFLNECEGYVSSILANLDKCIGDDGTADFRADGMKVSLHFFLDWQSYETPDAVPGAMMLILYALRKLRSMSTRTIDMTLVDSLIARLMHLANATVNMKQTRALQVLAADNTDGAREFLERGGARGYSTFMAYFIIKALSKAGSEKVLDDAKEYYGGMLDRGATTFWEDFDLDWLEGSGRIDEIPKENERDLHADYGAYCYKGLRHSLCHGWSSGIVAFAIEELVGLKILEPGFSKISIAPKLYSLGSLEAKIPTPHGIIGVSVRRGEEPIITLPDGVELL